jgi:plastin-1
VVQDSEALLILLNQLAPAQCDTSALGLSDLSKRAEAVLINAEKIDCRKFITPADIVKVKKPISHTITLSHYHNHKHTIVKQFTLLHFFDVRRVTVVF